LEENAFCWKQAFSLAAVLVILLFGIPREIKDVLSEFGLVFSRIENGRESG
jgi:hypothetical protein